MRVFHMLIASQRHMYVVGYTDPIDFVRDDIMQTDLSISHSATSSRLSGDARDNRGRRVRKGNEPRFVVIFLVSFLRPLRRAHVMRLFTPLVLSHLSLLPSCLLLYEVLYTISLY